MKGGGREEATPGASGAPDPNVARDATEPSPETLAGERGASVLHRARSLQSRVGQVLALGLMGAMAVGLLGWYYLHTLAQPGNVRRTAHAMGVRRWDGRSAYLFIVGLRRRGRQWRRQWRRRDHTRPL